VLEAFQEKDWTPNEIFVAFYLKLFGRSLSGLSSWRSTSLLHPTPFQPETGLEAAKEERQMLHSFNKFLVQFLKCLCSYRGGCSCFHANDGKMRLFLHLYVLIRNRFMTSYDMRFLGRFMTILLPWDPNTLERFHWF